MDEETKESSNELLMQEAAKRTVFELEDNDDVVDGVADTTVADLDLDASDRQVLIAGAEDVQELAPNKPIDQMSASEQKAFADKVVAEIDDHDEGIPFLPLNLSKFTVWSFENCLIPPDIPGEDNQPAVIITLASSDDPRGTPYILTRDRALKFASQLKRRANTGPSIEQRAAQAGLAVPPSSGGLILPGQ